MKLTTNYMYLSIHSVFLRLLSASITQCASNFIDYCSMSSTMYPDLALHLRLVVYLAKSSLLP
jgi:hypothetical protein